MPSLQTLQKEKHQLKAKLNRIKEQTETLKRDPVLSVLTDAELASRARSQYLFYRLFKMLGNTYNLNKAGWMLLSLTSSLSFMLFFAPIFIVPVVITAILAMGCFALAYINSHFINERKAFIKSYQHLEKTIAIRAENREELVTRNKLKVVNDKILMKKYDNCEECVTHVKLRKKLAAESGNKMASQKFEIVSFEEESQSTSSFHLTRRSYQGCKQAELVNTDTFTSTSTTMKSR